MSDMVQRTARFSPSSPHPALPRAQRTPADMQLAYPANDRTGFDAYADDSVAPEANFKSRANGYVVGCG